MTGLSYWGCHRAIKRFGKYRTLRTGEVAAEENDGLGQHHFLAKGMRETLLQNIESYADSDGNLVSETGKKPNDTGCFQINRVFNKDALEEMDAVAAGTWKPPVEGKTPYDRGYCPQFEDGLQFTRHRNKSIRAQARQVGVATGDLPQFVLEAHNRGFTGALTVYRRSGTAEFEYSEWILATAKRIKRWLLLHPRWKV